MDQVIQVPEGKDPTLDASPAALGKLKTDEERKERQAKAFPVQVFFDLQNYAIGKVEEGGDGQHVHLIVDNEPYLAIYDVRTGIDLPAKAMTPGTHVIRAFPSAGPKDAKGALHHEARKNPGAFAWVRFHVGAKGGPLETFDGTQPLLTFSRPKGEYKIGVPEHLKFLVDWYVTNAPLAKGKFGVRATLDGKPLGDGVFTTWERYVLPTPPEAGEHTLGLELLDADGKPVEGPFNKTERKFKVVSGNRPTARPPDAIGDASAGIGSSRSAPRRTRRASTAGLGIDAGTWRGPGRPPVAPMNDQRGGPSRGRRRPARPRGPPAATLEAGGPRVPEPSTGPEPSPRIERAMRDREARYDIVGGGAGGGAGGVPAGFGIARSKITSRGA